MTLEERAKITNFEKCDFSAIQKYYVKKAEERKQMSKEEKKVVGQRYNLRNLTTLFFFRN